jgi:hypothetical protein
MEYDFLGIDEGKQTLLRAKTSGAISWVTDLADYPTARAMQWISDDCILVGYDKGYFIADTNDGCILHSCDGWNEVTSAFRTEEGQTLLTGMNLGGRRGVWVLTLDAEDRIVSSARRRGNYVRLMRPTAEGTYLLCMNKRIVETRPDLKTVRRVRAPGFLHAWMARRLEDGSTLVSAGYGAFMALFSPKGKLVRTFGEEGRVPPEVRPYFYASFSVDDGGDILVANWQGHGPDNGDDGRQLVLFGSDGEYKASWSFPETVSSLQGLLPVPPLKSGRFS